MSPRLRVERLDDRLTPSGLDPTFGDGGRVRLPVDQPGSNAFDEVDDVVALPDGKVLFAGRAQSADYPDYGAVVGRLNPDGSPDPTFDGDGIALLPGVWFPALRLAVLPDGRAVAAGDGWDDAARGRVNWVVRLTADGQLDPTFDGDGVLGLPQAVFPDPAALGRVTAVAVAADGRVVLAGEVTRPHEPFYAASDFGVLRLTAGGRPDETFGPGGLRTVAFDLTADANFDRPAALAVLPDGRVLVADNATAGSFGGVTYPPNRTVAAVARLTADGQLDPTFGDGGKLTFDFPGAVTAGVTDLAVTADGRVVLAGNAGRELPPQLVMPSAQPIFAAARLTADGRLDPTFDGDGRVTVGGPDFFRTGTVSGLGVLPDGRVVLAGQARRPTPDAPGGPSVAAVVRLTADGAPDPAFGRGGLFAFPFATASEFDRVTAAAVLADGRTLLGGTAGSQPVGTQTDLGFAMLLADPGPDSADLSYPPEWDATPPVVPPPIEPPVPIPPEPTPPPGPPSGVPDDVNGDGTADMVVTGGGRLRVVGGADGSDLVPAFAPFEESYAGGLNVVTADLDGDGRAELVVSADDGGGGRVAVFRWQPDGTLARVADFLGIGDPGFRGGCRVAAGDVTGDGRPDLVVSAGRGGGPRVAVFDGAALTSGRPGLLADFFAFEPGLRDGVSVSVGDLDGDPCADLAFGGGPGGAPRVRVVGGAGLLAAGPFASLDEVPAAQVADFFAGDSSQRDGVRLALWDADGDGRDELVTGSGEGEPSRVRVYRADTLLAGGTTPDQVLDPFGAVPADGVFVG